MSQFPTPRPSKRSLSWQVTQFPIFDGETGRMLDHRWPLIRTAQNALFGASLPITAYARLPCLSGGIFCGFMAECGPRSLQPTGYRANRRGSMEAQLKVSFDKTNWTSILQWKLTDPSTRPQSHRPNNDESALSLRDRTDLIRFSRGHKPLNLRRLRMIGLAPSPNGAYVGGGGKNR